jgi:hypothetical protein
MPKREQKQAQSSGQVQAKSVNQKPTDTKIAIIGAGIAGLYCGFELDRQYEHEFLIAEASSHIGGRIWTTRVLENGKPPDDSVRLPDPDDKGGFEVPAGKIEFCAEFGPMRIELDFQQCLQS